MERNNPDVRPEISGVELELDGYSVLHPGYSIRHGQALFMLRNYLIGKVKKNVAPPPEVSSNPIFPASILVSSFAILSPKPKWDLSVRDLSAQ